MQASPPWPPPKSTAAGPLSILRQALSGTITVSNGNSGVIASSVNRILQLNNLNALSNATLNLVASQASPYVTNSVSGGILGALSLLAINWVLAWVLFRSPKVTVALEGQPSTLIRDGVVDEAELKKQTLSHEDLISILNRNGFNDPADIHLCVLEPNGGFFVKGKSPSSDDLDRREMLSLLQDLSTEVKALRSQLGSAS